MAKKPTGGGRRRMNRREAAQRARQNVKDAGTKGNRDYIKAPGFSILESVKEEKRVSFDIIPYVVSVDNHPDGIEPGDVWYRRDFWIHRNIGPEEKSVMCLRCFGERCPICEDRKRLSKNEDSDEDDIKALNAKQRSIFNVLTSDGKIALYEVSYHNFTKILLQTLKDIETDDDLSEDEILDHYLFFETEQGKSLKVKFSEASFGGHKFFEATRVDFKDRKDLDEDILDKACDLDTIFVKYDYEELEEMHLGIPSSSRADDCPEDPDEDPEEEEAEEEEEEEPRRRRGRRSQKEEPETEDDPEEEEEEEPEIPDGCEVCVACEGSGKSSRGKRCVPCKGKGYKKAVAKPKEEEEEESEDEESEEEKPSRTRRRRGRKAEEEQEEEQSSDDECPDGYEFGKDNGDYDECEECELWEACADKKEELEKKTRSRRRR